MSKSFKDYVIAPFTQTVVGVVGICPPMTSSVVERRTVSAI